MQLSYPPLQQLSQFATIPANAAGFTVNNAGQNVQQFFYRVTVTFANAGFIVAALTADITLITVPARTRINSFIADTTTAWAGLAGTISIVSGKTVGGAEYIATHDVKTIAVTKGLVDADMGSALLRAAAVQGGDIPAWAGTTVVQFRLTSGTGNIGTGAATNLTNGVTTFVIGLAVMP